MTKMIFVNLPVTDLAGHVWGAMWIDHAMSKGDVNNGAEA